MKEDWINELLVFFEKIARLAYINVLWIAFTVLGLVIFGFMPATAAMFSVLRAQIRGKQDTTVFQHFWKVYRKEFVKSNVLGLLLSIPGWIIYIDLFVFNFGSTAGMQMLHACLYIVGLLFLMGLAFIFPLYVQYELKTTKYVGLAFLLVFAAPFRALLLLILGYGIFFFMSKMPILIVFFLGSTVSSLWLMITLPAFQKIERQHRRPNQKSQPIIE
ncbi:YesL family protein [Domibacillus robiginosus]|uniref:YesL family protein n=1 Tax=Domibacillus robiginosus TaxID=1071054 RepID=UPI00067D8629|nr:DUF624 domain-containing protein [Domibacillus robiginosus]